MASWGGWLRHWDRMLFAATAVWGAMYCLHFQFRWAGLSTDALSDVPAQMAVAALMLNAARHAAPGSQLRRPWLCSEARLCLQAGMDDRVSKPFDVEKLRSLLVRWCPSGRSELSPATTGAARPATSLVERRPA